MFENCLVVSACLIELFNKYSSVCSTSHPPYSVVSFVGSVQNNLFVDLCSSLGVLVGETLAPCGWGDRKGSSVARLHCQTEYPYDSGSGQWSR